MSLWFTQTRSSNETGKFRRRAKFGTSTDAGGKYHDWSYRFVSHTTGTSVRRTRVSVSIADPAGNRLAYLRDFATVEQAKASALEWIDERLKQLWPKLHKNLGSIPPVPTRKKPAQEK